MIPPLIVIDIAFNRCLFVDEDGELIELSRAFREKKVKEKTLEEQTDFLIDYLQKEQERVKRARGVV